MRVVRLFLSPRFSAGLMVLLAPGEIFDPLSAQGGRESTAAPIAAVKAGPQTQRESQAMNDDLERDRRGRIPREDSVCDVMTPLPRAVDTSPSVMDAAEIMRDANIGDVVVLDSGLLYGILTDRNIVVRVLAEGDDPATVTVGQVCSRDLTTISSTASVRDAVSLIREKAIRRLPVVEEGGEVVGIVSMGDIAVARDPKSALSDVSAAPPNT